MALRLCDVRRDPVANRALEELMHRYTAAEEQNRLVLTAKEGSMKLFFYKLDDLHQLDFIDNQMMAKENEKLRGFLRTIYQQRESWKHRALAAEAGLVEATAKISNSGGRVSDFRYATLKRYLAKQFHPDYAQDKHRENCSERDFQGNLEGDRPPRSPSPGPLLCEGAMDGLIRDLSPCSMVTCGLACRLQQAHCRVGSS